MKKIIAILTLALAALAPVANTPVEALSYCGAGRTSTKGWAGCDSNAGAYSYVRVLLKCRHHYTGQVASQYGPWKFGANNDSITYCPSGYSSYAVYYQLA